MKKIITSVFVVIAVVAVECPKAHADALEAQGSGASSDLANFGSSIADAGVLLTTSAPEMSLAAAAAPSSIGGQAEALAEIAPPDDFATVKPAFLRLFLLRGQMTVEDVSITIHPFCVRPFEIDVVASDRAAMVENLTGVVLNGCGGDTKIHGRRPRAEF